MCCFGQMHNLMQNGIFVIWQMYCKMSLFALIIVMTCCNNVKCNIWITVDMKCNEEIELMQYPV